MQKLLSIFGTQKTAGSEHPDGSRTETRTSSIAASVIESFGESEMRKRTKVVAPGVRYEPTSTLPSFHPPVPARWVRAVTQTLPLVESSTTRSSFVAEL